MFTRSLGRGRGKTFAVVLGGCFMPDVKMQHYVPRFYLDSFTDGKYLCAVRRDNDGLGNVFKTQPMRVCAERYLYEVKARAVEHEGSYIEKGSVENNLGKIENRLAPVYRNVLDCLDRWSFPSGMECVELISGMCCLIASFLVRNPGWLEGVRGNASLRAEELLGDGFLTEDDVSQMAAEGFAGEFEAFVELAYLDTALFKTDEGSPMQALIELLLDMDCLFWLAPDGAEFVTASLPVYAAWADERDHDPVGVYFPLSPRYAVVLRCRADSESPVSISHASKELVDSFNRCIMNGNGAWDVLIARDRAVLEELLGSYRILD